VSLRHEYSNTTGLSLPSEAYCVAWMDALTSYLPLLASRQREIITRLAGWASWRELIAGCHIDGGFNMFDLSIEQRLGSLAAHRSILIHEFGVKAAYANHWLWNNPLGSKTIFEFKEADPSALYGADEKPSSNLPQILIDLDRHNLGMFADTEEGSQRACAFIDPAVHLGLCQHLGWELILDTDSEPVPGRVSADILGKIKTDELGEIEVYTTGLTRSPDDKVDENFDLLMDWAITHQATRDAPLIILYSEPMLRSLTQGPISVFGMLVADGNGWSLPLSSAARNIVDYSVDVMSALTLDAPVFLDIDFALARRFIFCKAREHDGMTREQAQALKPTVHVEGSGWGKIKLVAS
jgi:hypothetical protein